MILRLTLSTTPAQHLVAGPVSMIPRLTCHYYICRKSCCMISVNNPQTHLSLLHLPNLLFQGQCFMAVNPEMFAPGFGDRSSDLLSHLRNLEPVSEANSQDGQQLFFEKIWRNRILALLPGGLAPPPRGNPGSATVNDITSPTT